MKTSHFLCVISVMMFSGPCIAQMMSAPEYHDYLIRLDAAAERWQNQIKGIEIEKMKVDYPVGSRIEHTRDTLIENWKLMHQAIERQRPVETLSLDILIENSISDTEAQVDGLIEEMPENHEGVYWGRSLISLAKEVAEFQLPIRRHIDAYANKLELSAARCSK